MAYIVDQLFPPLRSDEVEDIEYSSFNYWRDPVPDLHDLDVTISSSGETKSNNGSPNASGTVTPTNTYTSTSQILNKSLPTIPESVKI